MRNSLDESKNEDFPLGLFTQISRKEVTEKRYISLPIVHAFHCIPMQLQDVFRHSNLKHRRRRTSQICESDRLYVCDSEADVLWLFLMEMGHWDPQFPVLAVSSRRHRVTRVICSMIVDLIAGRSTQCMAEWISQHSTNTVCSVLMWKVKIR